MATLPTPGGDTGTWGDELNEWLLVSHNADGSPKGPYVDVTQPPYNAVPDSYYFDGVAVSGDNTFTSATATFVAGDVGKTIVIEKARSYTRPFTTTIASVTSGTEVELTHAPTHSQTSCRFLISRGGNQQAAFEAAIDDVYEMGGGTVYANGPGFLISGLVLKNRVSLMGRGIRATCLHQVASANTTIVRNYVNGTEKAQFLTIRDIMLDGNADRQANYATTLGAAYTAGNTTITLATGAGANVLDAGVLLIGTNLVQYTSKSGDVLSGVVGGVENTTDANAANGAAVTAYTCNGIALLGQLSPTEANTGISEYGDNHFRVFDVNIRDTLGYGLTQFGQSDSRITRVIIMNAYEIGFRMTFDCWATDCTVLSSGRMNFYSRNSSIRFQGCKAFNAGAITASKGFGFLIEHIVVPAEGGVMLTACEAQDNRADGFWINQADRVTMAACHASSNGYSGTNRHGLGVGDGTYVGLKLSGANHCLVDCTSTDHGKNASPGAYQVNALYIDAASNHNQIRITHDRGSSLLNAVDFERAIRSDSDLSGGNHLVVNGQEGAVTVATIANTGTVTATVATNLLTRATHGLTTGDAVMFTTTTTLPAPLALNTVYYVIADGLTANDFKVSTTYNGTEVDLTTTGTGTHTMWEGYTPDPYKATTHRMTLGQTNTPIALPFRGHLGSRLILIIKQDGTGGRGATFHSSYVTNGARVNDEPNSYTQIEFYYDGTSWLTTERISVAALAANATANSTSTGVKISGLDLAGVGAGRYEFEYMVKYQSGATTTGVKFGVNHTGASSAIVATAFWPGVGTTAITVSDTDQVNAAFQLVGHTSTRSMTTTAPDLGPTNNVDTANADNLVLIKGLLTVTNTGTLELWHASEVSAASTVQAGSMVRLTKLT